MIEEDYVSVETARLLKEKGFDPDEYEVHYDPYNHQEYEITHQMARKWLRRVHGLFIRITEDMTGTVYEWSVYQKNYGCKASTYVEDSYELACEVAIKYCLENLI